MTAVPKENVFVGNYQLHPSEVPPWCTFAATESTGIVRVQAAEIISDEFGIDHFDYQERIDLAIAFFKEEGYSTLSDDMKRALRDVGATSLCTIEHLEINPEYIGCGYESKLFEYFFGAYHKAMWQVDCIADSNEHHLYTLYDFLDAAPYQNRYVMLRPPKEILVK